jgi:lysine 2,3-aminomutase
MDTARLTSGEDIMGAHKTLRTPEELAEAGLVAPEQVAALRPVAARYAVALTPALVGAIDPSDPHDPVARQFLPHAAELETREEERTDPIGDERHSPVPSIVHRYRDRVLLKLTHVCPVYCRFCFRREMVGPGKASALDEVSLAAAVAYIHEHDEIWEVILTGGDPLVLSPRRLKNVVNTLGEIAHVRILRWHTRVPVAAPERVTPGLVRILRGAAQTNYVVLHANHPNELTPAARAACARIIDAGIPMLSQSVLLGGVNDSVETLEALMRSLVEMRIKPYYLHHPDLAPGTGHHRIPIARGRSLVRDLHARASGLCQPDYVLDIPGGFAKARLNESDVADPSPGSGAEARLRDAEGAWHDYPPAC